MHAEKEQTFYSEEKPTWSSTKDSIEIIQNTYVYPML